MSSVKYILLSLCCICCLSSCNGQEPFGTEYVTLAKVIEMPLVNGRIDHMAVNLKKQILYVAALGNNSLEIIDLHNGILIHSITGLDEPQGVAYIPERDEIVVTNGGNGSCIFYNATTYAVTATIHLQSDADNVRYNPTSGKVYVGYGSGGIAVIDAMTHTQVGNVPLPAHPESFQIDQTHNRLLVNLPSANNIAVIDIVALKVLTTWKTNELSANFPITLDATTNQSIVGYRHPAVIVAYDNITGKEMSRTDLVSDVDDVFYDEAKQLVYATGGGGAINIFKKESNRFTKVANIPTRSGARTSLLIPSMQIFIIAQRTNGGRSASIAVYKVK